MVIGQASSFDKIHSIQNFAKLHAKRNFTSGFIYEICKNVEKLRKDFDHLFSSFGEIKPYLLHCTTTGILHQDNLKNRLICTRTS